MREGLGERDWEGGIGKKMSKETNWARGMEKKRLEVREGKRERNRAREREWEREWERE